MKSYKKNFIIWKIPEKTGKNPLKIKEKSGKKIKTLQQQNFQNPEKIRENPESG